MFLNNFNRLTLAAILALAALPCDAAQNAGRATRAIALTPAPLTAIPAVLIASACRKLTIPCNPLTTKAWVGAAPPLGETFLIDASRPLIAVLQHDTRAQLWDFSDYIHSQARSGQTPREPLEIYPALYPAGNGQYAIALVSHQRETYSGGGADFAIADFVALSPAPKPGAARHARRYAGVPFACSKMVRACFSEREYKTSRHCHDEMNGYLTIQFAVPGNGEAAWSFSWHQTDWPAHVSSSRMRRTRSRFTLPDDAAASKALPATVSFCGGPQ